MTERHTVPALLASVFSRLHPGATIGTGNAGALGQVGIGVLTAAAWTAIDQALAPRVGRWWAALLVVLSATALNGGRSWLDAGTFFARFLPEAARLVPPLMAPLAGAAILALQWIALGVADHARQAALLAAPLLGRWAVIVVATGTRSEGRGGRVDPELTFEGFALASTIALGVLFAAAELAGIAAFVAAGAATLSLRLVADRRFGGLPISAPGAACEVVQAAVLLTLAPL